MADVSPNLFIEALLGYQKTAAIKAALALDLFTAIERDGGDLDRLSTRTGASKRGLRILCDYLTVQGFLHKRDTYELTSSTRAFLTTSSPASMASVVNFLAAPEMISLWLTDPASYVRRGGAEGLGSLAPDHPIWVEFAKAMVPFMSPVADDVAREICSWSTTPKRVLDVAAGHGMFGIAVARAVPECTVTALDWEAVLAVATDNATRAGVADRYRTFPGSAFELDWGSGYDVVLLTNFLHHFDEPTCVGLLAKARASLAPGGKVLAVDFVPNEDRVSPPFPAMFSFMMLGSTPSGDAYTAAEFTRMSAAAGFSKITIKPLEPSPQSLMAFQP